jgi:uncharacterized radical SAM superfamily protein
MKILATGAHLDDTESRSVGPSIEVAKKAREGFVGTLAIGGSSRGPRGRRAEDLDLSKLTEEVGLRIANPENARLVDGKDGALLGA